MKNTRKGFTLIELMIVIAIIAIIAAIAIPGILSARRAANAGSALGNLKSFATAMATYAQDDASQKYPEETTGNTASFGDYYSHIPTKGGYKYSYYSNTNATNPNSKFVYFTAPTSMNNGTKIFFVDESNRIFEHTVTAEGDCAANVTINFNATDANNKITGFNWQAKS